jgi:hypothetical protein
MMPAAWLSTISPADAARKNTSHSCQKTRRRRSSASGAAALPAALSVAPDRAMSHALSAPVAPSMAASAQSAARTPKAPTHHPKNGAAIIAPAGRRLTT